MYSLNTTEVHAVAYIYDARGNGDGKTCCSIVGGHENRVTDYTAIVLEVNESICEAEKGADTNGLRNVDSK